MEKEQAEQVRTRREQREAQRLARSNSRGRGRGGPIAARGPVARLSDRPQRDQCTNHGLVYKSADNQPSATGEGRQGQGTRRDNVRQGAKKDEKGNEKK
ncbi:hypothetical protein PoHVEF18_004924 [Penicillium ochrochloron]